MLGINARVEDLREQLIKDIKDSHMPACILDYVITEILNDVRLKRMSAVQSERQNGRGGRNLCKGSGTDRRPLSRAKKAISKGYLCYPMPGRPDMVLRG